MKRFNAKQAQISYDLKDNCVGLSASPLFGGGGRFKACTARLSRG